MFNQTPDLEPQPPPPGNAAIIRQWLTLAICLFALGWLMHRYFDRVPAPPPGIIVSEDPQQALINHGKPIILKSYTLTPIASFTIRARVLSVEYYTSGRDAELSPVDFAVGWGSMSDSAVIDKISISQDGRWYYINYDGPPPIRNDLMITHSHNVHIIPANDEIEKILMDVRKNNIIDMQGYLVSVTGADNFQWVSSLTLDRQGPHTCKLMLLEKIKIE